MEIVQIECRCKDCEHYEPERLNDENLTYGKCYYWDYEIGMSPNGVDEDDFCSNGIRKEK